MTPKFWFKYKSLVVVVVAQSSGLLQNAIELSALAMHFPEGLQVAEPFSTSPVKEVLMDLLMSEATFTLKVK